MQYDTYNNNDNDSKGRPNIHTGTNSDGTVQWYADYNGLRYECEINNSEVVHTTTRCIGPISTVLDENHSGIPASSKWGLPKNVLQKIYAVWDRVENRE